MAFEGETLGMLPNWLWICWRAERPVPASNQVQFHQLVLNQLPTYVQVDGEPLESKVRSRLVSTKDVADTGP
jgi:hypothetical protein